MSNITARELQVAGLISHGATEKEIGNNLKISTDTVRSHKRSLFIKTGSRNIADVTRWFIREKEGIRRPTIASAFIALFIFAAAYLICPESLTKLSEALSQLATSIQSILK